MIRVIRYWLLAIAVACLGFYGYTYVGRVLYQAYESQEFDATPDRSAEAVVATTGKSAPIAHAGRAFVNSVSSTAPIGRLSIPRLHLSVMVREGIGRETLQLAVGHIPSTPLPGEAGNVGVAGHRDSFFRGLKDLRNKDVIQFSTLAGNYKYEVESLSIVQPDNVAVLAPSSMNVLTLVTCYPFSYFGAAPKRFVIRARQVSPPTATASTVE